MLDLMCYSPQPLGEKRYECARIAVRKDPHIREFYERVKHRRGEKKAIIAVARKLVSYAYWMLKRNITYEEPHPWLLP